MINTFPRMSHIVEYMQLSGKPRKLVVWELHLGTPSKGHLALRAHNDRLRAEQLA